MINKKASPIIVALRPELNDGNDTWMPDEFEGICKSITNSDFLDFNGDEVLLKEGYNHLNDDEDYSDENLVVKVILNFTLIDLQFHEKCIIYGCPAYSEWIDNKLVQKIIISEIVQERPKFYGSLNSKLIPEQLIEKTKYFIKPLSALQEALLEETQVLKIINTATKSGEDVFFVNKESHLNTIVKNDSLCLLENHIHCSIKVGGAIGIKHRLRIYSFKHESSIEIGPAYLTKSKSNICNGDTSVLKIYSPTNDQKEDINEIITKFILRLEELNPHKSLPYKSMFYGFDFVIDQNEKVKFIEINNHDSLALRTVSKQELPVEDQAITAFHNQLIEDYFDIQLLQKTVLIIGYGSYSKRNLFQWLAKVNAKIIIADAIKPALECNFEWIQIPIVDIDESTKIVLEYIENREIESVVSLYEDYIPLKHNIQCKLIKSGKLSTNYPANFENALLNKDKVSVYSRINMATGQFIDYRAYSFAPTSYCLNTIVDIENYHDGFPVILKYSTASSAFGCSKVNSKEELIEAFLNLKAVLAKCQESDGVGTQFKYQIFVSEWLTGSEHDIDIILNQGKVIFSVIADNTEIDPKQPRETGVTMPTLKFSKAETFQITKIVKDQLLKLGLNQGVFNVEFIDTPLGLKIIDVNPRPGGYYINDYIKRLFGIDTFKAEVLLNSSISYNCHPLIPKFKLKGKAIYSSDEFENCDFTVDLADSNYADKKPIDMIACASFII